MNDVGEEQTDLLGLTRTAMREFLASVGEKPYRGDQILKWIYHRNIDDFSKMTDLGKALRAKMAASAAITPPRVASDRLSADGTRKWLFELDCGNCVETVHIPDGDRGTLCISSQVGCALNCSFCATARQGFNRNLRTQEIVAQIWLAQQLLESPDNGGRSITNVVLMGMGEPLLNLANVIPALELMLDDLAFGLARKKITLSTAGVVPGIRSLARSCPVSLAVSLHAPDNPLRDELVPINRKYPIEVLLESCREFADALPRQKITFEYVMIDGVNDSLDHARRLIDRLSDIPAKVNLIPFNPFVGIPYHRSPPTVIERFRDRLMSAGLMTVTRKTRGDDIDAACGQLAGRVMARGRRSAAKKAMPSPTIAPCRPPLACPPPAPEACGGSPIDRPLG
ncbi:23S rRNA (adenine(2503)-C(2))-methyltransferase RlmN [Thioalkalivibrio sp. HK1]|uniref:23S rRNA (adenine(2503)-C(2))-methyltransferase RlmN n=1 Tax=Thioalkalivibrio sp. HK1 TaxID=1469245 RepID=UPI0027D2FD1D|nr:23S rRNA (adenine(2503)-C(2))-methyltransferase RlmN [Thioalkalivibrio sp. HK1]